MRRRDVIFVDLPGGGRLLVACDAAGGIGPKEQDRVRVPGYVLGRFTARVALMEVIAAGGRPILLVNTACVEPEPTGKEILAGIQDEARLAGLGPDVITGSWEKNIPTVQTGLGVTALGLAEGPAPQPLAGDLVLAIGRPKVGDEVSLTDPEIADLPLVCRLATDPRVHDLLPVGSRGIAAEAMEMARTSGLGLEWVEPAAGWDLGKSAGPATCVLAAVPPQALPELARSLDRPWTVVARLVPGASREGGRDGRKEEGSGMGRLTLVLGGARSGKSRYAERLAAPYRRVIYLATAEASDEEMAERIRRHRESRPAHWRTVEEGYSPAAALRRALAEEPAEAVVLDCVTLLLTNHMLRSADGFEERARRELLELIALCRAEGIDLIAVSNEVGQGLVPEYPLGRLFRDVQGRINQFLAREADRVYACIAGIAVDLKRIGEVIE